MKYLRALWDIIRTNFGRVSSIIVIFGGGLLVIGLGALIDKIGKFEPMPPAELTPGRVVVLVVVLGFIAYTAYLTIRQGRDMDRNKPKKV